MFCIIENHFLFVGLFVWGNAETQTFSVLVSRNWDGFALAESRTRKSGTREFKIQVQVATCTAKRTYEVIFGVFIKLRTSSYKFTT